MCNSIETTKDPHTYFIFSGLQEIIDIINKIMSERGNWKYSEAPNIDFMFEYSCNKLGNYSDMWKIKSNLRNISNHTIIANKSSLYELFCKYDKVLTKKYMATQYTISPLNYNKIVNMRAFAEYRIWIIKPVYSSNSVGISILESYDEFVNFMEEKKIEYDDAKPEGKTRLLWVLAEYLDDTFLYKKRKFHLRVPFLYFEGKTWLGTVSTIITAQKEYIKKNYKDKEIHDTHVRKSIPRLEFPRDFLADTDPKITESVHSQLITLFTHVSAIISRVDPPKCYDESKRCYTLFGADVMVMANGKIKLIEINGDAGFSQMLEQVFRGSIETIVDVIWPPANPIVKSNLFYSLNTYHDIDAPLLIEEKYPSRIIDHSQLALKYKSKYITMKEKMRL